MFQGLLKGSILLAGVGFLLIIITTPNASSEIMSRFYQSFEDRSDNQSAEEKK